MVAEQQQQNRIHKISLNKMSQAKSVPSLILSLPKSDKKTMFLHYELFSYNIDVANTDQ